MSRKKQQTDSKELIRPLVKIPDQKHALQVLFEGDPEKIPTLTSIGYAPIGIGNSWVSYVLKSRGKEIISIDVSEPNLRQIAEESAKTDFVENFMDKGV